MTGGNHVLEEEASRRHETLGFVLSVRTVEALHRQHKTYVFLCRTRAAKIFKSFTQQSLVLLVTRKYDKVCEEVLLEQCMPIDRAGRMRQAPKLLKIASSQQKARRD